MTICGLDLFSDMGPVWVTWAAVVVLAGLLGGRGAARLRRRRVDGSRGVGYTIGLIASLPVFALMASLFIETTFLLGAKLGTSYAALAVSKSWLVWESEGLSSALMNAAQASTLALASFSPGNPEIAALDGDERPEILDAARGFAVAVNRSAGEVFDDESLERKYLYASTHTKVSVEPAGTVDEQRIRRRATISYTYTLTFAWLGPIFGDPGGGASGRPTRVIESSVTFTTQEPLEYGLGLPPLAP